MRQLAEFCPSFGSAGAVDLRVGMGDWPPVAITAMPSSPPAIVNGVAVIGQSVTDLGSLDAPSGVIRGYDAETGTLRWAWDAGRPDRTLLQPGETYTRDTPNAWGVLSGDEELGLVFVPTGNSLPDYFGGMRWKFCGARLLIDRRHRRRDREGALDLPDRAPRFVGL